MLLLTIMAHLLHKSSLIKYATLCLAFCCVLSACTLDIPYENQFSDPKAITNATTAKELLASAYKELPDEEFDLSALSDDFVPTDWITRNSDLSNLYHWQKKQLEELSLNLWTSYYASINTVNALLERVDKINANSTEEGQLLKQIKSEAKILKAYCYFRLLQLFAADYGDGPDLDGIVLKDKVALEFLPRSSIAQCVTAIQTLLKEALADAPEQEDVCWLAKNSAYYLLAEVALYAHQYPEAVQYAEKVFQAKNQFTYLDAPHYSNLFSLKGCDACIYSHFTQNTYYSEINYDREKGDYLIVNPSVVEQYADGDLRKAATVFEKVMPDSTIMPNCLAKYNRLNWEKTPTQFINKQRVAGVCFILAQAYALQGAAYEEQACSIMNGYLTKRGAPAWTSKPTGAALMKAILAEKWKEFAGEGERYFDLKRYRKSYLADWNKAGKMSAHKRISADDFRWTLPIPRAEYLYNNKITQNPGWTKIES